MIAIYPGSFDPLTLGHYDLVERASVMCDTLYVSISSNITKTPLFLLDERVEMATEALSRFKNVIVESFDGLLADYATEKGAGYLIRGLRAVADFEFEFQLALMNRTLNPYIETIFMMPSQQYIFLSSTLIKDVARHGGELAKFVPANVEKRLRAKFPLKG
ncbi:MAG: pantetheine-phosphate adenylyltransferase [Deferribacterales bacterium]|nr:pantetheine-phosphate adenylyltransferase [Deferribacterales bacterium]